MAITLKTDYRKTLGLPGYSSHSFSASVEVEINNLENAPHEIKKLYYTLQRNVDTQIQSPGFVPPDSYGMMKQDKPDNVQSIENTWLCSDKQRKLILKLTQEQSMSLLSVNDLARERFGKQVQQLNKLEASGFIELLFESQPQKQYQQRGGAK